MKVAVIAGAPAAGKTSVLIKSILHLINDTNPTISVVKMDCLSSNDEKQYNKLGVHVTTGLSNDLCPDHFLAINFNHLYNWADKNKSDLMLIETAGLCNRCAPFITGALNICIIDSTASIKSPEKLGPMVATANMIVMTKCDMISQAERELLYERLSEINLNATILTVNGMTGAGSKKLSTALKHASHMKDIASQTLVYEMPAAVCAYCVGERRLGTEYHQGMINYMEV